MKKKSLFLSMMLLLAAVCAQAQSGNQMDERFNDGTEMPYGWFAEGWKVDDGKAKAKATVDKKNNGPGQGGGSEQGMGGGMGNMFGGDRIRTYMLTPPVNVQKGETLAFSARKVGSDDSGQGMGFSFDMKAIMGMTDTIFVVERTEYGKNQWVRVGEYTTTLTEDFDTYTISGTPAGKYRFRFVSYVDAEVDSVAGFHIDKEAPDLLVTVDSMHAHIMPYVDYSVCDRDSTKDYIVINTGTGTLKVKIASANAELFSVDKSEVSIAAGDSATVKVTFHYDKGQQGKNEAMLTFTPTDQRVVPTQVLAAAVITEPGVWFTDFNDNQMPFGCYGEGFVVKEGVATHYNPDGGGMPAFFGGGATDWFMTPPLTIKSETNAVIFSMWNGDGEYKGPIFDPQANVTVEKSIYGSNKWERVESYQFKDTLNHVKWISWLPAGDYRFRLVSGDSLCIDSIAGGFIRMDAPDLLVRHNKRAVQAVNFGIVRSAFTKTFELINTGTATLQLYAASSNPDLFSLSGETFTIEPGESATVDVTFHYDPNQLGAHHAALVLNPTNCDISPQMVYLSAYITYDDAWSEDFEPEFEVEPGEVVPLPEEWSTTGWQVTKGGGMDMMAMMGMGGGAEKTWGPHTDSDAYELISPRLQARKGDVLRFYADVSSGYLLLSYKRDGDADWTPHDTYITADSVYFIAPYTGVYQLRFVGKSVSVDDFLGFRLPMEEIEIFDDKDNSAVLEQYDGKTVNVNYDRVLSAVPDGKGGWQSKAYTVCLPYDFDFSQYADNGQVSVYRLVMVDDIYHEFTFTNDHPVASAGLGYLAVVNYGSVSLSAKGVQIAASLRHEELADMTAVYRYKDYKDGKTDMQPVGTWRGTYKAIENAEGSALAAYACYPGGRMKLINSETEEGRNRRIGTFRAFYEPKDHKSIGADDCLIRYVPTLAGDMDEIQFVDFPADLFDGDATTGIEPTLYHVIESDGSHRYFDLQGRQLSGKPAKGLYIKDGKKYSQK